MSAVFLKVLNMSITASWLILAIIPARLILKKAPKWILCLLWGLVAIRLICPFSFESALSLVPSNETIPPNIAEQHEPAIDSGITIVNESVNPVIAESFTPAPEASANPLQIVIPLAAMIWVAGIFIMLAYAIISWLKLKQSVSACVPVGERLLACDEVRMPFILGVFRPFIYVPSSMDAKTLTYVIRHEKAHLQRHDHWWKPLGFLLLSVYWFNPLCWIAYILLCRDIEMACDEKVIHDMDRADIAAYSQALLTCSFRQKRIAACPLAFGEVSVKERVKGVLNYKKSAFWIIAAAIIVCIALAVCLMTDPKKNVYSVSADSAVQQTEPDPVQQVEPSPTLQVEPSPVQQAEPSPALHTEPDPALKAEAFLTVTSEGQSVAAYPIMLYERTWTAEGWHYVDGSPAAAEVTQNPGQIPTVTLGADFSVVFGGGAVRKSGLNVYDEQFVPLRESWYGDTALNWLTPGTYYCVIEVHGPLGAYIQSEDAYEESAYSCIFRLIVSEEGPAPYMPGEIHDLTQATLHYLGKDYVLTDSDSLNQLTEWLSDATELIGGGACPFGSMLTLTRRDGSEISLCPAEDSCGTVFSGGHYYRYSSGNEEFWSLFDVKLFWME